jgi:hypothetical protein
VRSDRDKRRVERSSEYAAARRKRLADAHRRLYHKAPSQRGFLFFSEIVIEAAEHGAQRGKVERDLIEAFTRREFERDGQSVVSLFSPSELQYHIDPAHYLAAAPYPYENLDWRQFGLTWLCVSREQASRWFDRYNYPRPPYFNPTEVASADDRDVRKLRDNEVGSTTIHQAIAAVFDLAKTQGVRRPNVRTICEPVQRWLVKYKRKAASAALIQKLAGDPRYTEQKNKPGVTVRGTLRPLSDLTI